MGKAKIPLSRPTLVKVWRDNSRRVRTHEKKIGAPVCPLSKILQSIFLSPIRSQYSLDCLRMVWWESVNRGSNVFSRTTWLPLGLQGWRQGRLWLECVYWNAYIRETVSGWRHVLWVATLARWSHFHGDLNLLFLCRFLQKFACLFLLRRRKDRSIHPIRVFHFPSYTTP